MEIELEKVKYAGLATGMLGMLLLAFLLPEDGKSSISEINKEKTGEKVTISGTVKGLRISKGNAFFEMEDTARVKVVYFSPPRTQIAMLREGRRVRISGIVSTYKGDVQLIAQKVSRVD